MSTEKLWQPPVPRDKEVMRLLKQVKKEGRSIGPYIREAIREKLIREGYMKSPAIPVK